MSERRCKAVTASGQPCKARPLRDQDWCLLHSPESSPAELGRKGGRGRGKQADELELTDREAALAALRRSLDSGNAAAVVAAGKALLEIAQKEPGQDWSSDAKVKSAREELARRITAIADRRRDTELAEELRSAFTREGDDQAEPIRDRYGTSLGDVFKYALSIGVDPLKPGAGQDISRAAELLRRYSVPEDDEAWVRLRGDGRRKQERDAACDAAREAAQSPLEVEVVPEVAPKLDAVDELLMRHGGAASDAGFIYDDEPIGRHALDW